MFLCSSIVSRSNHQVVLCLVDGCFHVIFTLRMTQKQWCLNATDEQVNHSTDIDRHYLSRAFRCSVAGYSICMRKVPLRFEERTVIRTLGHGLCLPITGKFANLSCRIDRVRIFFSWPWPLWELSLRSLLSLSCFLISAGGFHWERIRWFHGNLCFVRNYARVARERHSHLGRAYMH